MLKKISKLMSLVLLISLIAPAANALAAPPYQADDQAGLIDVATEDGRFTTLLAALDQADLVDTLAGEGPFTIFAPTDEAFARLPEGTIEDLFADPAALTNVLLYHVVEGRVLAADVMQLDTIQALTGQELDVTVDGEAVQINSAQLLETDREASNGIIHVIDTVLIPSTGEDTTLTGDTVDDSATTPDATEPEGTGEEAAIAETAVQAAACSEDYVVQADDSLSKIADKFFSNPQAYAGIVEATNNAAAENTLYNVIDDPDFIFIGQTLCIPGSPDQPTSGAEDSGEAVISGDETPATGEEMVSIPEGKGMLLLENLTAVDLIFDVSGPMPDSIVIVPDTTKEIFLDPGQYTYNGHQPGGDFVLIPGGFEIEAGQITAISCVASSNCQLVDLTQMEGMEEDAMAEETPVVAEADIVDTAIADGGFTTLVAALDTAGLTETLKGEGPFTVFAPTDEAFSQLPEGALDELLANPDELADVLRYHVVSGQVMAADIVTLDSADTILGQPLEITVEGDTVSVNDAQVITTDIETSNGVIHVIDSVLLPPETETE